MARFAHNHSSERACMRLFPEEKIRLQEAAKNQGITVSEFIRKALEPWISNTQTTLSMKHIET